VPELPEVETVRRGIEPLIVGRKIESVVCRVPRLRWDIPVDLEKHVSGQNIISVERRAKYLFLRLDRGTLVLHLGMTGILRVLGTETGLQKHDHFDLVFDNGNCLRLNDSRRFGAVFFIDGEIENNTLIMHLGPEPLSNDFNSKYLYELSRYRKVPIKNFLMDQKVVVGVGNIYASEALFLAGIDPRRSAGKISRKRYESLVTEIKLLLAKAIEQGGTTIRDFSGTDGKPGYFKQQLTVYGREEQPCVKCHAPIRKVRQGGRSTFYCPGCQKR
jgi:formamidopyrimidine-DNA glycosylase